MQADRPPGAPGLAPTWTSSAKTAVGTALTPASRVWFTISHGILDEIYFPRPDRACTRDFGLLVTGPQEFLSEEKRDTVHALSPLAPGIPAFHLLNTCKRGRYRIEKTILTDPVRDVLLQQVRFVPLVGELRDYRLYALLAPHLDNHGRDNTAQVGDYKGVPMLFATREERALALACSAPWLGCSAGYVGVSDGWQDLHAHEQMTWHYARAEHGNVALMGEVDLQSCGGELIFALGFGDTAAEAGLKASASLLGSFDESRDCYVEEWAAWHRQRPASAPADIDPDEELLAQTSVAILRVHEDKIFPGGIIASLSIPWGESKGDDDMGGYHLVWPRDLVEAAGGLLAARALPDVLRVVRFLQATQEQDGHWPQNMWLDGNAYWNGVQLDETALPILLIDLVRREHALDDDELVRLWPTVRCAAQYLIRNGPVTPQDRWETDPGYSPFTLAVVIAALLAAADLAHMLGVEACAATYLQETADHWNSRLERWTYVTDTELARKAGVEGHYVRIAPPETAEAASPKFGYVPIKDRPPDREHGKASYIVSPDALALVRFGLRRADDPRILNTVRVVDAVLEAELPQGACWRRYPEDLYGEYPDGRPFDGGGVGRCWPLLTGERAHFELAAGRRKRAERLRRTLARFAGPAGLIPEQVWDAPDLPARELFLGQPSGSAKPLVWAHAEYLKLCRSLQDRAVFDTPRHTVQRYLVEGTGSRHAVWRPNHKITACSEGEVLRLESPSPALAVWRVNGGPPVRAKLSTTDLGMFIADLPTEHLPRETRIQFALVEADEPSSATLPFEVKIEGPR